MTTAEQAYIGKHTEANELLDHIRDLLADMPAPEGETKIHYGHVGDLCNVVAGLAEIVQFLGG
jgi:hypothetical protein